jgi:predicted DNA-binding protein
MQTVTVKFPAALNKKLTKFAHAQDRPKSHLIRKAVEEYLREMEEDTADLKVALERIKNSTGKTIPWSEIKRRYGLDA